MSHLTVQDVRERTHDGIVFTLILEQGAVRFLRLNITVLRRVAERLGEDALREDLRIGGGRHICQLRVAAQLFSQGADHNAVRICEIAFVQFIDPLDDRVQRILVFRL